MLSNINIPHLLSMQNKIIIIDLLILHSCSIINYSYLSTISYIEKTRIRNCKYIWWSGSLLNDLWLFETVFETVFQN